MKPLLFIFFLLYTPLAAAPLIVGTSVSPQATLVQKVGGERVQVITLIPPGANPHTYNLRPRQLAQISKAQLYIAIGNDFSFEQTWLNRIISLNPNLKIVNCSQTVITHTDHEHLDPHFWLSPRGCKIAIDNITQGLTDADPKGKHTYQANQKTYKTKLDSLNTWVIQTLANLQTRTILVYHPAWTHFAHDFNLTQLAIEHEGKDPTPKHMAYLITQAKKHGIRTIFSEPQFNNASAKTIANEINGKIIYLDPLAPDPITNIQTLTRTIADQH